MECKIFSKKFPPDNAFVLIEFPALTFFRFRYIFIPLPLR